MSENFEKVKNYYLKKLWDIKKLKNAVGRWITEEEFDYIVKNTSIE